MSSFIDMTGNTVWTEEQISRYCERLILNQFNKRRIRELDDMITGAAQGRYTLTTEEQAEVQAYGDLRFSVRAQRLAAIEDNNLLAQVIEYESATRRKAELELLINGREAVEEVPEERDPETGEITQDYVKPEEAIEPLEHTIEKDGETVDNPVYLGVVAELAECQAVIDEAAAEVLTKVALRAGV